MPWAKKKKQCEILRKKKIPKSQSKCEILRKQTKSQNPKANAKYSVIKQKNANLFCLSLVLWGGDYGLDPRGGWGGDYGLDPVLGLRD